MNQILDGLLKMVSDWTGKFDGAFNIRENGGCAGRRSTEHIKIESKRISPGWTSASCRARRANRCPSPRASRTAAWTI